MKTIYSRAVLRADSESEIHFSICLAIPRISGPLCQLLGGLLWVHEFEKAKYLWNGWSQREMDFRFGISVKFFSFLVGLGLGICLGLVICLGFVLSLRLKLKIWLNLSIP